MTGQTTRWGWRVLVTVSGLLVLNGAALYLFIVDTHVEQTIGLLLAAFGACTLAAAIDGLRRGSVSSWRLTWILVVALSLLGAHALRGERSDIPALYLTLAAVALIGQFLARPAASRGDHASGQAHV